MGEIKVIIEKLIYTIIERRDKLSENKDGHKQMDEPYVEELSDYKCPLCGRFYSLGEVEVIEALKERNEERWPCCFRCVLASPDLRIGVVGSHCEEKLDSMLTKYDGDYEKALERKFAKNFIP